MLQSSDVLPSLTFARVCGGEIHSPGDPGEFGMVVFHRGFGYGFGNAWLARATDKFGGKTSRSSRYRWTIGKIRRRSSKSASAVFRSPTAPMHERFSLPPALSSMTLPSILRQPALAIGASGRLMPDDVLGLFPKSYLRQRTEEQRPIGGEVGKWRSHL